MEYAVGKFEEIKKWHEQQDQINRNYTEAKLPPTATCLGLLCLGCFVFLLFVITWFRRMFVQILLLIFLLEQEAFLMSNTFKYYHLYRVVLNLSFFLRTINHQEPTSFFQIDSKILFGLETLLLNLLHKIRLPIPLLLLLAKNLLFLAFQNDYQ